MAVTRSQASKPSNRSNRKASKARGSTRSRSRSVSTRGREKRTGGRSKSCRDVKSSKQQDRNRKCDQKREVSVPYGKSSKQQDRNGKCDQKSEVRNESWKELMCYTSGSNRCSRMGCKHGVSHLPALNKYVALDCEFAHTKAGKSSLGRCSIVDAAGRILLDVYSGPRYPIRDYKTEWCGRHAKDAEHSQPFKYVRCQAKKILHNKILVGHSLQNDLKALDLKHPKQMTRDTSSYAPLRTLAHLNEGNLPALKDLSDRLLGQKIQRGEHCSVEDSQATMDVFLTVRRRWENELLDLHQGCKSGTEASKHHQDNKRSEQLKGKGQGQSNRSRRRRRGERQRHESISNERDSSNSDSSVSSCDSMDESDSSCSSRSNSRSTDKGGNDKLKGKGQGQSNGSGRRRRRRRGKRQRHESISNERDSSSSDSSVSSCDSMDESDSSCSNQGNSRSTDKGGNDKLKDKGQGQSNGSGRRRRRRRGKRQRPESISNDGQQQRQQRQGQ